MKRLIRRHDAQKYLTNGWNVTFVGEFEDCEPVKITAENFENYKDTCGDWYASIWFSVGDILYYPTSLYKIVKIGKRKIKLKNTEGHKESALISDIRKDKHVKVEVKIPAYVGREFGWLSSEVESPGN